MFLDRLSSFERCLSSLLRLSMALLRSLLRIHKASLLETLTSTFPYFHISIFLYFYFHDFLNHCKQIGVYPKYLIFNSRMFLIKTLYRFVKDFFLVPSTSVIKNSNMFQKNPVYLKTFHLHSFLLLTFTSLQNL